MTPPASETAEPQFNTPEDLAYCDRIEPRFPGASLSYGVLLVLPIGESRVVAASENAASALGVAADVLFERGLEAAFGSRLQDALATRTFNRITHLGRFQSRGSATWFEASVHDTAQWRLLELEPWPGDTVEPGRDGALHALSHIGDYLEELKSAASPEAVIAAALRSIGTLTGYDTILYVDFLADGTSQVSAEVSNGAFESYLDKRFPRSDIPESARRNMLTVSMVYSPDIASAPVPLRAGPGGPASTTVDMGRALLRSVHETCNRFYLNVGIRGKLIIPLVESGQQFASINCWNATAQGIDFANRQIARTVAEMAGRLIREKTETRERELVLHATSRITGLLDSLDSDAGLESGLRRLAAFLPEIIEGCGSAIWSHEHVFSNGTVPPRAALYRLERLLGAGKDVHVSDSEPLLAGSDPAAPNPQLAGVMAAPLLVDGYYLAIFRPAWETEVRWAGNPAKPVEIDLTTGERRLTARGSFETWRQEVRGRSRPWSKADALIFDLVYRNLSIWQARLLAQRTSEIKARLLAEVSHEIRSPLNAIAGVSRMLSRNRDVNEAGKLISQLSTAVDHTLNVVNSVLDLSRLESDRIRLENEPFSLSDLVERALLIVSDRAEEKGLRLQTNFEYMPDLLRGDSTRLAQMLTNYLANAVKFTPSGSVTVNVSADEERDGRVLARFRVIDTGIGMNREEVDRLFIEFSQANDSVARSHGGTGLGLAITRRLAAMMGGDAGVSSMLREGSTFWFTCWLEIDEGVASAQRADEADCLRRLRAFASGKRVLVVEDDEINQVVARSALEEAGLLVECVDSGGDALWVLANLRHFDLVLMDMRLPDMSGIEATTAIRAHPEMRRIPVIAVTGDTSAETRQACLEAGMDDFVGKRFEFAELYSVLVRHLVD